MNNKFFFESIKVVKHVRKTETPNISPIPKFSQQIENVHIEKTIVYSSQLYPGSDLSVKKLSDHSSATLLIFHRPSWICKAANLSKRYKTLVAIMHSDSLRPADSQSQYIIIL